MIEVMNHDHTKTEHNGDAVPCPRCKRQPLFASSPYAGVVMNVRVDAFCGCEDMGGIVDTGVHRLGVAVDDAARAALLSWNTHDHVMFRLFDERGQVRRVVRVGDR